MVPIVAILILATFIIVGVLNNTRATNNDDFFLMGRKARSSDYVISTIAYNFQVAITIYFIYWGFKYGWSNIIFLASWGIGILFYSKFSHHLYLHLSKRMTYFNILFERSIYKITAIMFFVVSLIGLIYTELHFATSFITLATMKQFNLPENDGYYWLFFIAITLTVIFYSLLGGMRKIIVTDKLQFGLGLFAIQLLFAILIPQTSERGFYTLLTSYGPIIILFAVVLYLCVPRNSLTDKGAKTKADLAPIILTSLGFAVLLVNFINHLSYSVNLDQPAILPKGIFSLFQEPNAIWPVIGFSIANIIWQFGDYTAYHRLSFMRFSGDVKYDVRKVKNSIQKTALLSPLTWSFGIFLGMVINVSGIVEQSSEQVVQSFFNYLLSMSQDGDLLSSLGLVSITIFFTCILLSTVDSGIISMGKLIINESLFKSNAEFSRVISLCTVSLIIIALGVAHSEFKVDILVALNLFYAWGIVFGPPFLFKLINQEVSNTRCFWAAVLGAISATLVAINSQNVPFLISSTLPSTVGILISLAIMLFDSNSLKTAQHLNLRSFGNERN